MIGTVRREFLDDVLFWSGADLETKLGEFQDYYKGFRAHSPCAGSVPCPRWKRAHEQISTSIDGSGIAEVCIKHPWPPDDDRPAAERKIAWSDVVTAVRLMGLRHVGRDHR
jgi:hypothetical protein